MPFFNKIRKALIGTNGLKSYLLYAVGEILLVMIGILLALEVSNWSEDRKERIIEKELLNGILIGLQSDSADMAYNIGQHKKSLISQKIVLAWLNGTAPFPDSLKRHLAFAHTFTSFTATDGPYEILKTSGPQLIQNQEVRTMISRLYDNTYDIYRVREQIYNTMMMEGFTRINGSLFYGSTPYQLDSPDLIGEMEPFDPVALRDSKAFKHQMKTLTNFNELIVDISMIPSEKKVNKLIVQIREELDKK